MTEEQQKEQFSIAYVRGVAAVAGVNTYKPEVDDDSVDIGFATKVVRDRVQRPRIEAQLKCTQLFSEIEGHWHFTLKLKNYNDLREDSLVPRILIVLFVPTDPNAWLEQSADQMLLRKAAYWVQLAGSPATTNSTSVTIPIPKTNLFDVQALRRLLQMESTP